MAELLQREYSLPVVKVRLVQLGPTPAVNVELIVNKDGGQQIDQGGEYLLDSFGFGETTGSQGPTLVVPPGLVETVARWARRDPAPERVLWLQLKKPYGQLGAVPWERFLQPALGVPLLRLPDVLPDAPASSSTFHLALCAISPSGEGPALGTCVPEIAKALLAAIGGRLRLHVFADLESLPQLEAELAALCGPQATVYRPTPEFEHAETTAPEPQNAWLTWIREATSGQTLDGVHFVAHGYALGTEGAILTTTSPSSADRMYPQTLQAGELRAFLTQVGALVVGFTVPLNNYSDYGLLKLVDDIGAVRAGPVLLHDPRNDPGGGALTEAYRLVSAPDHEVPPAASALVLFVQPRQVGVETKSTLPAEMQFETLGLSPAVRYHLHKEDTPLWLAAAERYISESEADLTRFRQSTIEQEPTNAQIAYYAGVESALHKIRSVVDSQAEAHL